MKLEVQCLVFLCLGPAWSQNNFSFVVMIPNFKKTVSFQIVEKCFLLNMIVIKVNEAGKICAAPLNLQEGGVCAAEVFL